jgi:hypothetical protein
MSIEAMKLTDLHDHPEPHTMKWTKAEMDYINNRVETAVRQAIEQAQKQEPVAWIEHHKAGDNLVWDEPHKGTPLYTSPPASVNEAPQRQPWVGLTDEEIKHIEETTTCLGNESWLRNLTRNIEAKLKSKNGFDSTEKNT